MKQVIIIISTATIHCQSPSQEVGPRGIYLTQTEQKSSPA